MDKLTELIKRALESNDTFKYVSEIVEFKGDYIGDEYAHIYVKSDVTCTQLSDMCDVLVTKDLLINISPCTYGKVNTILIGVRDNISIE